MNPPIITLSPVWTKARVEMFPRVEVSTCTVPEPANSGTIFGAPLIGPPYIPGGCETPSTTKDAITSGPIKSSLIIEPLTRMRPTVSPMRSLACKVSTPLPTLASEPLPPMKPEKDGVHVVCAHCQVICS